MTLSHEVLYLHVAAAGNLNVGIVADHVPHVHVTAAFHNDEQIVRVHLTVGSEITAAKDVHRREVGSTDINRHFLAAAEHVPSAAVVSLGYRQGSAVRFHRHHIHISLVACYGHLRLSAVRLSEHYVGPSLDVYLREICHVHLAARFLPAIHVHLRNHSVAAAPGHRSAACHHCSHESCHHYHSVHKHIIYFFKEKRRFDKILFDKVICPLVYLLIRRLKAPESCIAPLIILFHIMKF